MVCVPFDAHPYHSGEPEMLDDRLFGHPIAVWVYHERCPRRGVEPELAPALEVFLEHPGGLHLLEPHLCKLLRSMALGEQRPAQLLLAGDEGLAAEGVTQLVQV